MTKDESSSNFEKLEFWALTAVFVFCLPLYMDGFYSSTARYITVFLSTLYINFRVSPRLAIGEQLTRSIVILVIIAIALLGVYFLTTLFLYGDTGRAAHVEVLWNAAGQSLLVLLIIAGHITVKRGALFMISKEPVLR